MYGNVWEWTFDRYDLKFYQRDEATMTNLANKNAASTNRVLRGGSFIFPAVIARSAVRYWFAPGYMVC
ncbi:MAG: SUMF1/EgtB/PvdO family nonheme iron enzyme [Sandaracinus sp.]|nr:SUMF1/EgtB/PvdO family nonheme iron enzyme [Sandaracinus sp.]